MSRLDIFLINEFLGAFLTWSAINVNRQLDFGAAVLKGIERRCRVLHRLVKENMMTGPCSVH